MPGLRPCPSPEQLRELFAGRLGDDRAEDLERHLTECEACGRAAATLQVPDPLAETMRAGATLADRPDPPQVTDLIRRLKHFPWVANSPSESRPSQAPPGEESSGGYPFLDPPQGPGEIGRLGLYRILRVLGAGGMGVVFEAEDTQLRRPVALKVLHAAQAAGAAARERFVREARSAASLDHDHIVTIHQVGEDRGVPYLAMQLLKGQSLQDRLEAANQRRAAPLLPAEVLRIGREVAEGLAAAHARGLIHRDIKPANIWLETLAGGEGMDSSRFRVKILDFGLARPTADAHLTQEGVIIGTPAYMAPEQARAGAVDQRSDLFSLGCVLYLLGTGHMPFKGPDAITTLVSVALDSPRRPREVNPEVPPALSDLVMRLLARDPTERPSSAQEVVAALRLIEERPDADLSLLDPTSPPRRRAWVAGLLLAVFLAGSLVWYFQSDREPSSTTARKPTTAPPTNRPKDKLSSARRRSPRARRESPDPAAKGMEAWIQGTATLPPQRQVKRVVAKLRELNPRFDGRVEHRIEKGVVRVFRLVTDEVTNLTPLRAFPGLRFLVCRGSGSGKGRLADLRPLHGLGLTHLDCGGNRIKDLSPLKGMPLNYLSCWHTRVRDLRPLRGMPLLDLACEGVPIEDLSPLKESPLKRLNCGGTRVTDLTPLKGLPLTYLACYNTHVTDLKPLRGMRLKTLWFSHTRISDLSPLKDMPLDKLVFWATPVRDLRPLCGMPLTRLFCSNTPVSDLTPLRGMKLVALRIQQTRVTDLSPIRGMPLRAIWYDGKTERDLKILRGIRTLEQVNDQPAAEFWKKVKAGKK
jgi:serine/threonine protein kinase